MSRLFRRQTRSSGPARRPVSPRARLLVRALEDRDVPTTYTVNVLTDNAPTGNGVGSGTAGDLRYCIMAAANGDTVDATGVTGTILLGKGLTTQHSITISGPGPGLLTVDGGYHGTVLTVQYPASSFNMSGVTIARGSGLPAGGLAVGGTVTITNSVITGCSNFLGAGGIALNGGNVLLQDCSITGNTGNQGGGISVDRYSMLTVQNCSVVGNKALSQGGGFWGFGNAITVSNSTIANNSAAGIGGGFYGPANITGSTITGNTAGTVAGGLYGFGLYSASVSLDSTVVAGNVAVNNPDIYAGTVAATHSAIGTLTGYTLVDLGGNLPVGTPLHLGPLSNVTGPGGTFAMVPLGPGSPALYAGDPALNGTTDERGVPRPQFGTTPAIGAYEWVSDSPTGTAAATNVTTVGGSATYQFTVTYRDLTAVQYASISGNTNAVVVTGYLHSSTVTPAVSFVSATPASNAGLIVATYQFTVPGGPWTAADNGTWVITAQPNQVVNTNGVTVPAGPIGQFTVAFPATYTVTNTNDNGPGSLRQAILEVDSDAANPNVVPADTIVFSASTAGGATNFYDGTPHIIPWQSSAAHVMVTDPVTIVGPGAAALTVTANGTDRVMTVNTEPGQTVSLSGLTLAGGIASGPGGGIDLVNSNLNVTNSVITGNHASTRGGGIYASAFAGAVTVSDSTISGNTAGGGGGVYASLKGTASLLLTNCTLTGNKAGAQGGAGGGAIAIAGPVGSAPGVFHVTGCTLAGNSASGQGGGAISVFRLPADTAITNSTIVNNLAPSGGAMLVRVGSFNTGAVSVTSTTMTGNTATAGAGAFAGDGGGIAVRPFGGGPFNLLLQSSIVAGNVAADGQSDLAATAGYTFTADHSLIGVSDTVAFSAASANNLMGTAAAPLDPRLGGLKDNGGPTMTVSLRPNSPAIDGGSNPGNLTTDQRGFPRVFGPAPDIGAVEYQPTYPAAIVPTLPTVTTAGGTSYQFAVTYTDPAGVAVASLGDANIRVTGPGGFNQLAYLVSAPPVNGPTVAAVYSITPPGGAWQPSALGGYTVSTEPNQVFDTAGAAVPADVVGRFQVAIPITVIVTSLAANGPGTLTQAILDTNANPVPSGNTILFDPVLFAAGPATMDLPGGLPYISNSLTLVGPGSGLLTIRRSPSLASYIGFQIFTISDLPIGESAAISGLTIRDARSFTNGAAIQNGASLLTLTDVAVTANSAVYWNGGGIYSTGSLTLTDVTVTDNSCYGGGGGIFCGGALSLTDCRVTNNTANGGGGISHAGTNPLSISDSVISGNWAGVGGGIYDANGAYIKVGGTTISHNTSGSGGGVALKGGGQLELVASTVDGNTANWGGGGLYWLNGGGMLIDRSTISNNLASYASPGWAAATAGGIVFNGTPATSGPVPGLVIQNSTIVGNHSKFDGGITLNSPGVGGTLTVRSSTVTGNSSTATNPLPYFAGGITLSNGNWTLNLDSTIVSGNQATNGYDDIAVPYFGAVNTTYSAIGNPSGFNYTPGAGDLYIGAPLNLQPLADNGGPTQTVAFGAGSPLLDAGDPTTTLTTDQRGQPRAVGTAPDIGAYEYVPMTVANVQVNDGSAQRSEVRSITVTFSGTVSFVGPSAASAFQLQQVQTGVNTNLAAAVSVNGAGQTVVTLTFLPTNIINGVDDTDPVSGQNGGPLSLADGRYQLTVLGSAVSDAALGWAFDGDGDGVPGGDYQSPADTPSGGGLHLYRLFGDATGDGRVDLSDLAAFRAAYNAAGGSASYLAYLDADNSGAIDLTDLHEFGKRFNHSVFS
jgi:predicted outer membrane repeat protein